MSILYSIEIKLDAKCNEDDIATILERGAQKGFRYYDRIGEIRDREAALLDVRTTAKKIVEAYETKPELGPCVYTVFSNNDPDENFRLWFYKKDGFLKLYMGSFGCPRRKEYLIDFAYYVRLCLDLVEDFQIMEVRTTMI